MAGGCKDVEVRGARPACARPRPPSAPPPCARPCPCERPSPLKAGGIRPWRQSGSSCAAPSGGEALLGACRPRARRARSLGCMPVSLKRFAAVEYAGLLAPEMPVEQPKGPSVGLVAGRLRPPWAPYSQPPVHVFQLVPDRNARVEDRFRSLAERLARLAGVRRHVFLGGSLSLFFLARQTSSLAPVLGRKPSLAGTEPLRPAPPPPPRAPPPPPCHPCLQHQASRVAGPLSIFPSLGRPL